VSKRQPIAFDEVLAGEYKALRPHSGSNWASRGRRELDVAARSELARGVVAAVM
jgi:hypothetical protein